LRRGQRQQRGERQTGHRQGEAQQAAGDHGQASGRPPPRSSGGSEPRAQCPSFRWPGPV
jgi:hypothetical protein